MPPLPHSEHRRGPLPKNTNINTRPTIMSRLPYVGARRAPISSPQGPHCNAQPKESRIPHPPTQPPPAHQQRAVRRRQEPRPGKRARRQRSHAAHSTGSRAAPAGRRAASSPRGWCRSAGWQTGPGPARRQEGREHSIVRRRAGLPSPSHRALAAGPSGGVGWAGAGGRAAEAARQREGCPGQTAPIITAGVPAWGSSSADAS